MTERVLAVLAAALSVVAGVLAVWGTRASCRSRADPVGVAVNQVGGIAWGARWPTRLAWR
jgi:hypothetical protein